MSVFSAYFAWHRAQLTRAPYTTNIIQSGTLMACGDVVAQSIERDAAKDASVPYKASRTLILASWGGFFNATFWVAFYRLLHARLPGQTVSWVAAAAAVSPFFNTAFFSFTESATHVVNEGWPHRAHERARLFDKVRGKLDECLVPTVQRSLTVWVPFNFFLFTYIPLPLRTLAGSCVGLGWNVYLSLVAAAKVGPAVSMGSEKAQTALV
jgi:hypothetical protein